MWRTPPEMRHWYQHIYIFCNPIVYYSQIKLCNLPAVDSPEPVSRAPSPEPVSRAPSPEPVFSATDLSAQHPQGFGSPPNIALSGSGKPHMYVPRTSLSLYIYMPASSGLRNTPSWTLLFHYIYIPFRTNPAGAVVQR